LGTTEGRAAFLDLPSKLPQLRYIGVGVTESGIVKNGPSIVVLAELLLKCFQTLPGMFICRVALCVCCVF
jgi:hypothetical protein